MIKDFLGKLTGSGKDTFRANVLLLAGGTGIAQLFAAACMPILTRLYTPADFGGLTVYSSLFGILVLAVALRYELAIPIPADERTAAALAAAGFAGVLLISGSAAALVWLFNDEISRLLGAPGLNKSLYLLPIGLLGGGAYSLLSHYALRCKEFGVVSRTRVAQGVSQSILQVVCGLIISGPFGLVLGDIAGRITGSASILGVVKQRLREHLRGSTPAQFAKAAMLYWKFPALIVPSSLLNSGGLLVFPIFFAGMFGANTAGFYGLGHRPSIVVAPQK